MENSSSTSANSVSGGTSVGGGVGVSSMGRAQVNCSTGSTKDKTSSTPNNTNMSNTPGAASNYSSGGGSTVKNHTVSSSSTGSQPVYPSPAEHLPKLKSILPVASQCIYTPCYW